MVKSDSLVSIIIPMYNAENFISVMIDSVIHQTYANWELIIVDDISTDNSFTIASKYAVEDSRIRLQKRLDTEKKGAPSCRNIGLRLATGKYVIFLDADDYIAEYCLQQRVSFMEQHNDCDFAIFPALSFQKHLLDGNSFLGYKTENNVLENLIIGALPFVVVTNIYKLDVLINKNIYWDENLRSLQDSFYNITAIVNGLKYKFSNGKPDYFWRVAGNANSISKKIVSKAHFESRQYFFNKLVRLFGNEKKYSNALLLLSNRYYQMDLNFSDRNGVCTFLSSPFFNKYLFLKKKLLYLYPLLSGVSKRNHYVFLLLFTFFCPRFEIRSYFYWRKIAKKNRELLVQLKTSIMQTDENLVNIHI